MVEVLILTFISHSSWLAAQKFFQSNTVFSCTLCILSIVPNIFCCNWFSVWSCFCNSCDFCWLFFMFQFFDNDKSTAHFCVLWKKITRRSTCKSDTVYESSLQINKHVQKSVHLRINGSKLNKKCHIHKFISFDMCTWMLALICYQICNNCT